MFETKKECEAYIAETYGVDYVKFGIVTAQKVDPTIAKMLSIKEGYYPSNAY